MSSKLALIVTLVAACGGSAATQPQPEPKPAATDDDVASKLGAARSAMADERWDDALVIVDEVLAADPDNAEAKRLGATAIAERDRQRQQPAEPVSDQESEAELGGEPGGVEGGVVDDLGAPPPPPPPPSAQPNVVPVQALEAQRVAGTKALLPPDDVKLAIQRDGKTKVVAVVKMCVGASGAVDSLKLIKSSGYEGYDYFLLTEMNDWKYRPFMVNGKAVPVCTAVTFIYSQKS